MQRHGVGLTANMARHHRHRTKLAHGTGITKNDAIEQAPFDVGQGHTPKNLQTTGTQDHGGLLFFIALRLHQGNEFPRNERESDEHGGQHHARHSKNNLDVIRLQPRAKPTLCPENQDINKTRHHRRHRKRQVHQGGEKCLATKLKLGNRPRSTHAKYQIQRYSDDCDEEGQFDGRPCIGFFQRFIKSVKTFSQCFCEHRCQGQYQKQADKHQGNANQGATQPHRLTCAVQGMGGC